MIDNNRKTANNTSKINAMKHHTAVKNTSPKIPPSIVVFVFLLCAPQFLTGCASPAVAAAESMLSPIDELRLETGRGVDDARHCMAGATRYHDLGEYSLSYRLYSRCIENGWLAGRDFHRVLLGDAQALATAHPEKRMTVLREDGKKQAEQWPVVRISAEEKTRIWMEKGVTPKKDWLREKEWALLQPSAAEKGIESTDDRPSLTLEDCRRTLERYDLLREHVQALLDGTEDRLVREAPGDAALESLRRDLLALKKDIRIARTEFVSYTLVSPFLAETVRLRRIADDNFFQMLFNHRANAGKRLDAISMLALACHNAILMSCTEDVRIQFCDVVSGLKRISRPAEWEHFKTVTTMLDSYDPSKKRGADAWWE